ncbi:SAC3 domain-containing protein 1 isoform X2 [Leptinotarsa decemlineata]|uniref:SAC3 domain-containing protein 1 isoform X2 n=1 Tax=Leptinotarsa decemlineata TaxID=7539 RepID=UPI003D30A632
MNKIYYKNFKKVELENNYVTGTCMEMCPEAELKMRERERLLHPFEMLVGTERDILPKADKTRTVKSFSRSAAGKLTPDPRSLRPPDILVKTVSYLLDDVISRTGVQWRVIYDFVMDRLRSVRQDMIIQNISRQHQINILQPIVKFLAFASYKLCEESIHDFDPHINDSHLQECLKRLLCMYDYCDEMEKSTDGDEHEYSDESRSYFEALYVVFNLGNTTAITRAVNLPNKWKDCFKIMSNAYSSKNLFFPVAVLQKILLYNNEDEIVSDCNYYGIKVKENGVVFLKTDFDSKKPVVSLKRRSVVLDEKFSCLDISAVILSCQ